MFCIVFTFFFDLRTSTILKVQKFCEIFVFIVIREKSISHLVRNNHFFPGDEWAWRFHRKKVKRYRNFFMVMAYIDSYRNNFFLLQGKKILTMTLKLNFKSTRQLGRYMSLMDKYFYWKKGNKVLVDSSYILLFSWIEPGGKSLLYTKSSLSFYYIRQLCLEEKEIKQKSSRKQNGAKKNFYW